MSFCMKAEFRKVASFIKPRLLELIVNESAFHFGPLSLELGQLLQPPLAHALPLQLLFDHFRVLSIGVSHLSGLDLLLLFVDGGHGDRAELAHIFGSLRHHHADLFGSLGLLLTVHAGVTDPLSEFDHRSFHDESGLGVLLLVLVEEQQAALAALFAVLPLDALGSLDVRVLVLFHVAEFVRVFDDVDHPGAVSGPHGELLQLAVQNQHHLAAQAVVDMEGLLPIVVFLSVSRVRAHNTSRDHLRHVGLLSK